MTNTEPQIPMDYAVDLAARLNRQCIRLRAENQWLRDSRRLAWECFALAVVALVAGGWQIFVGRGNLWQRRC